MLAGEVFPTAVRGKGTASPPRSPRSARLVATAFLFPLLLKDLGTQMPLAILIVASLAGAVITWLFRIETAGVNLETLQSRGAVRPGPFSRQTAAAMMNARDMAVASDQNAQAVETAGGSSPDEWVGWYCRNRWPIPFFRSTAHRR